MKRSKKIALTAVMLALIILFSMLPINLGVASIALTLLPVIIMALTQDFKLSVVAGFMMGMMSMIGSYTVGAASITAPIFQNPLVSVLPRICVPLVAWAIHKLAVKIFVKTEQKRSKQIPKALKMIADGVASALAVVTNTALVLGMIWLLYGGKTVGTTAINTEFMMGLVSINFTIELIVFTILSPPIAYAIRKQEEKQ